MIRKLRWSFVRVTMLSAALVLVILMGLVNILNYVQRDSTDRAILTLLAENGGRFPQDGKLHGGRFQRLTAEDVYGVSYFSVSLGADGTVLYMDASRAPWIDTADAVTMAQTLQKAGQTSGVYGEYKYTASYHGADVMYIFLTWSQNMAAIRSFFVNSVIVTVIGLAVLFGLAWLLSDRAVRPIAESYEKQKSFITNAGHELKTPLAVIGSSTDVIEIENGESQWTRSIHSQVERLTSLTQQLIALARMDEGAANLVLEDVDLSALVSDTLDPFSMMAEAAGIPFAAEIAPDIRLHTSRDAVEKICAILADNAVKYTAPGGGIRFSLTRENGRVILREENPAEGLSPGRQERLFDRFYRADASHSSEKPGYGLGLPLARSLAEALGGSVTANSPDGKTLVVTVHLH